MTDKDNASLSTPISKEANSLRRFANAFNIIGYVILVSSCLAFIPVLVALFVDEGSALPFVIVVGLLLISFFCFIASTRFEALATITEAAQLYKDLNTKASAIKEETSVKPQTCQNKEEVLDATSTIYPLDDIIQVDIKFTKPYAIVIKGNTIGTRSWKDTLVAVVEYLYNNDPDQFLELERKQSLFCGKNIFVATLGELKEVNAPLERYVTIEGELLGDGRHKRYADDTLCIYRNLSSEYVVAYLGGIMIILGWDREDLIIRLAE